MKMDSDQMVKIFKNLDRESYRELGRVIFGHELWFENLQSDFKTDVYSADLKYGHNMIQDRNGRKTPQEYLNPYAFDALGNPIKVTMEELDEGWGGHRVSFKGTGHAPYTLYNETYPMIWNLINDGSWTVGSKKDYSDVKVSGNYEMYAKVVFSEGDIVQHEHAILEILPDRLELKVGERASFQIKYEGKPVAGKEVKFYNRDHNTEFFDTTDSDGNASLAVQDEGDWMILVRQKDASKAVDDEFDEAVFVTTLFMKARE